MDDKCVCANQDSLAGVLKTVYLFLEGQNFRQTCQTFLNETEDMGYAQLRKSIARVLVLKPSLTEIVKISHADPAKSELHVQTEDPVPTRSCLVNTCAEDVTCRKASSKHVCIYYGEPLCNTMSAPMLGSDGRCSCKRNYDCRHDMTIVQTIDNTGNDAETRRILKQAIEEEVKICPPPKPDPEEIYYRLYTEAAAMETPVTQTMAASEHPRDIHSTYMHTEEPSVESQFVRIEHPIDTESQASNARSMTISQQQSIPYVSTTDYDTHSKASTAASVVQSLVRGIPSRTYSAHPEVQNVVDDLTNIQEYTPNTEHELLIRTEDYKESPSVPKTSLTTIVSKELNPSYHSVNRSHETTNRTDTTSDIQSNQDSNISTDTRFNRSEPGIRSAQPSGTASRIQSSQDNKPSTVSYNLAESKSNKSQLRTRSEVPSSTANRTDTSSDIQSIQDNNASTVSNISTDSRFNRSEPGLRSVHIGEAKSAAPSRTYTTSYIQSLQDNKPSTVSYNLADNKSTKSQLRTRSAPVAEAPSATADRADTSSDIQSFQDNKASTVSNVSTGLRSEVPSAAASRAYTTSQIESVQDNRPSTVSYNLAENKSNKSQLQARSAQEAEVTPVQSSYASEMDTVQQAKKSVSELDESRSYGASSHISRPVSLTLEESRSHGASTHISRPVSTTLEESRSHGASSHISRPVSTTLEESRSHGASSHISRPVSITQPVKSGSCSNLSNQELDDRSKVALSASTVRFHMHGKIVEPTQSGDPSTASNLATYSVQEVESKSPNLTLSPSKSILRVEVEKTEPTEVEINVVTSRHSLPEISNRDLHGKTGGCDGGICSGNRRSTLRDQVSSIAPEQASRTTMVRPSSQCMGSSTPAVRSSCRSISAKPVVVSRALSAQTVDGYPELDYNKLKRELRHGCPGETDIILQALRWRITLSSPEHRNEVITSYTRHDLLSLHGTPTNHRTLVEHFICPPSNVKQSRQHEEGMARLVNAMASLTVGRDYLCQDESLLRGVIIPLVMGTHPNKPELGAITKEHLLVVLQKFSLRNNMRLIMIQSGLAEYLVHYLSSVHNAMSDYCLEYTLALFMNLCLHVEAIARLKRKSRDVVNFFSIFLSSNHDECLSYINGAMYSLFMDTDIRKEAKHAHLDSKILEKAGMCDEEIRQQFDVILEILMANKQNLPCSECECIDQDDEVDHLEEELETDDTVIGDPNGEDMLALYYLEEEGVDYSGIIPLTCVCRPVTPYKKISALDKCPHKDWEDPSAMSQPVSSVSQKLYSTDSFDKKQQKSCLCCSNQRSRQASRHSSIRSSNIECHTKDCPGECEDTIPTKESSLKSLHSQPVSPYGTTSQLGTVSRQQMASGSRLQAAPSSRSQIAASSRQLPTTTSRPVSRQSLVSRRSDSPCSGNSPCGGNSPNSAASRSRQASMLSASRSRQMRESNMSCSPSRQTSILASRISGTNVVGNEESCRSISCVDAASAIKPSLRSSLKSGIVRPCGSHQSLATDTCGNACGSRQSIKPCAISASSNTSRQSLLKEPCGQTCGKQPSLRSVTSRQSLTSVSKQQSLGAVGSRHSIREAITGSQLTKQESIMRSLKDLEEIEEEKQQISTVSDQNIAMMAPSEDKAIQESYLESQIIPHEDKGTVYAPSKRKADRPPEVATAPPVTYTRCIIGNQEKADYCYMPNPYMLTPCAPSPCTPLPPCAPPPCVVPPSACNATRLVAAPCVPYSMCYREDPCNYYQNMRMMSCQPTQQQQLQQDRHNRYSCDCYNNIRQFSDSLSGQPSQGTYQSRSDVGQTKGGSGCRRKSFCSRRNM